jgi:hypothetical protein
MFDKPVRGFSVDGLTRQQSQEHDRIFRLSDKLGRRL